jgi:hypothetical protein
MQPIETLGFYVVCFSFSKFALVRALLRVMKETNVGRTAQYVKRENYPDV